MRGYLRTVLCVIFVLGLLSSTALAGSVTLSWDAPTTNEDGSPLTDLGGYTLYWATQSGGYAAPAGNLDVGNALTVTVDVPDNTWFVVTAYDTSGNQSGYSNEVNFQLSPGVPSNLRLGN